MTGIMSKIKITILCENRAGLTKNIIGEHGFSALVEKDGEKILLDTGQGLGLKPNARALDIELSQVDTLLPFFKKTRIIAHPEVFGPKYSHIKENISKPFNYIGTPVSKDAIVSLYYKKTFKKYQTESFFQDRYQGLQILK